MHKVTASCNNQLIIKRRKRKLHKRCFVLSVTAAVTAVILCYKLPCFNIKSIDVTHNKAVSSKNIIKESGISVGSNIFRIKSNKITENIMKDPYISSVQVSKIFLSKIVISINERKPAFYIKKDKFFYLIDKDGFILEQKDYFNCRYLIEIKGINTGSLKTGCRLPLNDERCYSVIRQFSDIESENEKSFDISSIDVSNILDIKAYCNDFCIKIGNSENLSEKLNKALLILQIKGLKNAKGYVDVSYDGDPVFFTKK